MADRQQYTIGWISALSTESVAAQALLDEEHHDIRTRPQNDNNNYTLGRIGHHNVVIAILPDGEYGAASAAAVARDMLRTFPNVRLGFLVGIGSGAPSLKQDIRLGDVVVSSRSGGRGGVLQYDYGKALQTGNASFQYMDFLNQPPMALRTAVAALKSKHIRKGHQLNAKVEEALQKWPRLKLEFSRPPPESDRLYKSDILHANARQDCGAVCGSDPALLVSRAERGEYQDDPAIHYGLIASANRLMEDVRVRDRLSAENGVLCFEMEAAGLMNHFPCLVIKGISDYADSHKSKEWQGFAAMTAAAYAKELLLTIPPDQPRQETLSSQAISDPLLHKMVLYNTREALTGKTHELNVRFENGKRIECPKSL
ncbi:pfs domain-containing protein [Verticillium alfalfae VaMs.102]|uniref:Pfs domain-containing protein n=1 Tax=Verticillium alfalfae (strain VaMs.102 / ATCC MYA-4576 / FGSC 10136) TaxID=526221 RepID=C9SCF7_VERA1|nr:pfs domain-containing protein [Verticillium alfalfae VaMs.102]EEY16772.1 pfs domain-containing protein [Verticillium alfalfae VaMs.102]